MACPNLLFSRTVVILRILIIIFNILTLTYLKSFKINIKQIIFGYSKIQCGIQTLISGCKIKQARRTDSEGTSKSTTAYPTRLFQSLTIFVSSIFSVCFSVYKHVEYLHHKLPLHNSFNIKIQVCTYIRCNTKHCSKNDV